MGTLLEKLLLWELPQLEEEKRRQHPYLQPKRLQGQERQQHPCLQPHRLRRRSDLAL